MVDKNEEEGLYARAHQKILDEIEYLKGETLTREQWYKVCNINIYNPDHGEHKKAINRVLYELSVRNKKSLLSKSGNTYKVIDDTLEPIDFKRPKGKKVDLVFPFGIHKYGYLYEGNIMIVFGSKDAGKTAFLLNFIRMNMHNHMIHYFTSEMADKELSDRLSKHNDLSVDDWVFSPWDKCYDFDQVLFRDDINLIDFLELGGGDDAEYFKGVALVRKIYDRMRGGKGVAIIALQKNKDAEYPKGGQGMLEKARIAVSLDPNRATLRVCKNWEDGVITSPIGKSWSYQLVGGINYVNVSQVC